MQNGKVIPINLDTDDDSKEWHTCPYAEDIYGDSTTLCDCSPEETWQCAMDI